MDANRFLTHSLRDPRVTRILAAALDAVEPGELVRRYLLNNPLPEHKHIYLLGIGKASEAMTFAAAETLTHFTDALAITKHASGRTLERVAIIEGGHPIPDERSAEAGGAALKFVSELNEDDLLICLISGGGSALMTAPQAGISLEDIQSLTKELLSCGANIDEINLLRSKLDRIKGGGLARATRAKILSLILSDVLGNPLAIIASGPTVPNSKINSEAHSILVKYNLLKNIPVSIINTLESDSLLSALSMQEQAHPVQNIIIGDIQTAVQATLTQAKQEGFETELLSLDLQGEAREVGLQMAKKLKQASNNKQRPFCLIAGGETTVTVKGNGKGGRNQELALAAVKSLDGLEDILLVSLATDGDDGPTDAAGAVVNGETRQRAERLGLFAANYLSRNDSHTYFESIGDLIKSGYTGTNVNDLLFLFGFQSF